VVTFLALHLCGSLSCDLDLDPYDTQSGDQPLHCIFAVPLAIGPQAALQGILDSWVLVLSAIPKYRAIGQQGFYLAGGAESGLEILMEK
jgi:hypothetical protein